MKNIGIVRNLDEVGRITLPIEIRRSLDLHQDDPVEIMQEGNRIVLTKYQPCDIFNGDTEELIEYCGKKISKKNIEALAKLAGLIEE
ncbi:MAG: AbrB/MazE/SpoVT family DNA-binding domain-containing protein [Lachnospiraceae bacterium]